MQRSDLLLYLFGQYDSLATQLGVTDTDDTPTGYGPTLDAVLLALGNSADVLATAEVPVASVPDAYALADYYALRWYLRRAATSVDSATGPVRQQRSQAFKQIKELLLLAQQDIASRGYGPDTVQWGRVQLDILEPAGELGGGYGWGQWG